MAADAVFYPHAIRALQIADGTTELFCATLLDEVSPNNAFSDLVSFCAAQVGPQLTGSHQATPGVSFSSPQLTTLLTVTIAGDYYVAADLSAYNVDLYYQKGEDLGTRIAAAATSHWKARMSANAMLCLESLSAEQGGIAQGRFSLLARVAQDGSHPVVPSTGVAIAGTASGGGIHTLGPVKVNGTLLTGVQSVSLENNLEYDIVLSEGDEFPSLIVVRRYKPMLTIRSRRSSYFSTYGDKGVALSSFTWYLRNKLASGINEADANAYHIKLSASSGTIKPRSVSGDNSVVELQVDLTQPSANTAAYTLAVNQAIT